MLDLLNGLEEDRRLMKRASEELRKRGHELAKAENEYQVAKHTRCLQLKAEGYSATMISLIIKGDDEVSTKLLARDIAQVDYQSAIEALNVYKLDSRLLEAQLQREWSQQ